MVKIALRFVEQRGKSLRYRRRVPDEIRKSVGRESWTKTWPPGTDLATVEREAQQLAQLHDRLIEAHRIGQAEGIAQQMIRDGSQHWFMEFLQQGFEDFGKDWRKDPMTRVIVRSIEGQGTYTPESLSLSEALERDRRIHTPDTDPRAAHYAVQSFTAAVGDLDVLSIQRRHVSDWLASMRSSGLSPATIKRRYGSLKALVGRALLDYDSEHRNPFDGFKMSEGNGAAKRVPFNRAMLGLIDSYIDSGRCGFEVVALIRIMRTTGLTVGEAGGLVLSDLRPAHETPHVLIRVNALRGVKTSARTRPVPIVDSMALEVAIEAQGRAQQRAGDLGPDRVQLFPGFHLERGADLLSAKVVKAIRAAGVPRSPRLTAHSFRHTVSEALRVAGTAYHLQRRILGHASRDESDIYGATTARLAELADAMATALPFLGEVDEANYSDTERVGVP